MLKRDDEEPAPWTREGKERMKKLGLTMQVHGGGGCLVRGGDEQPSIVLTGSGYVTTDFFITPCFSIPKGTWKLLQTKIKKTARK